MFNYIFYHIFIYGCYLRILIYICFIYVCIYMYIYIYIYIFVYVYACKFTWIYIYIFLTCIFTFNLKLHIFLYDLLRGHPRSLENNDPKLKLRHSVSHKSLTASVSFYAPYCYRSTLILYKACALTATTLIWFLTCSLDMATSMADCRCRRRYHFPDPKTG